MVGRVGPGYRKRSDRNLLRAINGSIEKWEAVRTAINRQCELCTYDEAVGLGNCRLCPIGPIDISLDHCSENYHDIVIGAHRLLNELYDARYKVLKRVRKARK